jgi:hypothetical protein
MVTARGGDQLPAQLVNPCLRLRVVPIPLALDLAELGDNGRCINAVAVSIQNDVYRGVIGQDRASMGG